MPIWYFVFDMHISAYSDHPKLTISNSKNWFLFDVEFIIIFNISFVTSHGCRKLSYCVCCRLACNSPFYVKHWKISSFRILIESRHLFIETKHLFSFQKSIIGANLNRNQNFDNVYLVSTDIIIWLQPYIVML